MPRMHAPAAAAQTPPGDEYARFARIYDAALNPFLDGLRRAVGEALLAAGARRVLDVCCGTGRQLVLLDGLRMAGAGVDSSPAMLAVARRACPAYVPLLLADAARLPLASGAFDAALVSFALHEKEQPVREAMLAESLRVLAPGGRLFVVDYRRPGGAAGQLMRGAVRVVERLAGRAHHALYRDYMRRGATRGLLERTGREAVCRGRFLQGNVGLYEVRVRDDAARERGGSGVR